MPDDDSLVAHIITAASGVVWSWPARDHSIDPSLPLFAFPPSLYPDRPTMNAFATSDSAGSRRYGHALGWLSGEAHVLCILLHEPTDDDLIVESLLIAHQRLQSSTESVPAAASVRVAPVLAALATVLRAHGPPTASLRRGHENALFGLCRSLRPAGLLQAFLAVLLEERVLLVAREPLTLFRAAVALVAAMA